MTINTRAGQGLARGVAIAVVVALVIAAVLWWVLRETNEKRYSAVFTGTVGLYEGNDVRVLGVRVGHVDKVTPQGDTVRVDLLVEREVTIPADAGAVIVAPSLVSDRYVQLTPAHTGGPELAVGTLIPLERTATPLEVDDLYESLNRVTTTLGPNGANRSGALADLLDTLARNAAGNGQAINETVDQLSQLTGTLSDHQGDLFGTVDNLARFTATLAASDQQVREFAEQVADVTNFLASERENLAAVVDQLSTALGMVQQFINDNRSRLKSNVDKLATITQVLVDQRAALSEVLDVAPVALSNIINSYNGSAGTLDARADINELAQPPIVMVCNLLRTAAPEGIPVALRDACAQLAPIVQGLVPLPSAVEVLTAFRNGSLPALPMPLAGMVYGTQGGA